MSDEEREEGRKPGRGGDRVEDAIERLAKDADRVEDAVERAMRRHEAASTHLAAPIHVHVDVNCKCSDCAPCPAGPAEPGDGGRRGRPTHETGTSDGSSSKGGIIDVGGIVGIVTRPASVWPGSRAQLYLPFLFIRASAGDTGARPVAGVCWESPDIFVLPGVAPAQAPAIPQTLGGVAQSGVDNTVYAHVWNLGQAPAFDVLVEFYWFDPALGFSDSDANLIGATWIDLGARGGRGSSMVVKCPEAWQALYVNGGHECLVVRASQPVTDPLAGPPWDSRSNRHVGQRNIHVMSAAEAAATPTIGVKVGPLFGGTAQVGVTRADAATMPWLHLITMSRTQTFATGAATGDVGLTPPVPAGALLPKLGAVADPRGAGLIGDGHGVNADGQQVGFVATDGDPGSGNAHVYRITGTQDGTVFGGYTVVVVN